MENIISSNISPMINSKQPVLDVTRAKESAESFEAFFLSRMMESMFEGVSTDGMFGGGHAEKIYRSLLLDEYGKEMAKLGTVGVKDYVMQAILQMQESASQEEALSI